MSYCHLVWDHIADMYHTDLDQDLHQLPKLTVQHIHLTSFSKMKVRLAAQVLSNTVGTALCRHYPNGGDKTVKFCEMVNTQYPINYRAYKKVKRVSGTIQQS